MDTQGEVRGSGRSSRTRTTLQGVPEQEESLLLQHRSNTATLTRHKKLWVQAIKGVTISVSYGLVRHADYSNYCRKLNRDLPTDGSTKLQNLEQMTNRNIEQRKSTGGCESGQPSAQTKKPGPRGTVRQTGFCAAPKSPKNMKTRSRSGQNSGPGYPWEERTHTQRHTQVGTNTQPLCSALSGALKFPGGSQDKITDGDLQEIHEQ